MRQWKTTLAREEVMCDSAGMRLTGATALIRTFVLQRLLRKYALDESEKYVGVLVPPTVPGTLANIALTLDGRVAVNLNYTLSADMINRCIAKAGIRHLITSRKVMEKLRFEPTCEVVYLEDFVPKITLWDKLVCLYRAKCWSLRKTLRKFRLDKLDPDDTLAVLFTSGTTGDPKGVMLSHANLGANILACEKFFHLTSQDRMACVLPTFHSMGYMATLWACMAIGMRAFYHFSPLDRRMMAEICRNHKPTIVCGTPTFFRLYAAGLKPEDVTSVNQFMSGAERCPVELMDEYERRFGVRPVQGYGITETGPVVAASLSRLRALPGDPAPRDAALGLPLPSVQVKVLNLDTGEPCAAGETGMIWVAGPSVMKGYLDEPELTAKVLRDGWYCTGDLGYLDADGFLYMSGRLSRFSKIGGEMVPHEGIENLLNEILQNPGDEAAKICVTAVPDERKGEKIVVLYTELSRPVEEIGPAILARKFPSLWVPGNDAYLKIDAIPVLGTGKLDLSAIREMAEKHFG